MEDKWTLILLQKINLLTNVTRVLVDVTEVDTSTTCLGSNVAFPLGFSPSANHGLAHPDAE